MTGPESRSEPVMTAKEAIMEIRSDVKELLAWKNRLLGGLLVVGSGAFVSLALAIVGLIR